MSTRAELILLFVAWCVIGGISNVFRLEAGQLFTPVEFFPGAALSWAASDSRLAGLHDWFDVLTAVGIFGLMLWRGWPRGGRPGAPRP